MQFRSATRLSLRHELAQSSLSLSFVFFLAFPTSLLPLFFASRDELSLFTLLFFSFPPSRMRFDTVFVFFRVTLGRKRSTTLNDTVPTTSIDYFEKRKESHQFFSIHYPRLLFLSFFLSRSLSLALSHSFHSRPHFAHRATNGRTVCWLRELVARRDRFCLLFSPLPSSRSLLLLHRCANFAIRTLFFFHISISPSHTPINSLIFLSISLSHSHK